MQIKSISSFAFIWTGVFVIGLASPSTAHASADRCANKWDVRDLKVNSCIDVRGNKRYVEKVRAGVHLAQYKAARGYFSIRLPGEREILTAEKFYDNRSFKANTKYDDWINIKREIRPGEACVVFFENTGNNKYKGHERVCIEIKR